MVVFGILEIARVIEGWRQGRKAGAERKEVRGYRQEGRDGTREGGRVACTQVVMEADTEP